MKVFYGLLVRFLRIVLAVFFRQIEVVGQEHIPDGPVIFVGNHPNSLIDPVLITIGSGRKLHFLAKDTLFKWPPLRMVLATLGAIPVKRRQDHKGGSLDNKGPFEALFRLLGIGGACGIFPEGISHAESELAPLKTGAARIALESGAQQRGQKTIQIVPCGLCYYRRTRMRSRVLVQFGAPIVIDEERIKAWEGDERERVNELTAEIDSAIRALTINASDWETLRVLDGIRRVYTANTDLPLVKHAELTRRFTSHYEVHKDKPEIQELFADAKRYFADLEALGMTERELSREPTIPKMIGRALGHLILLFVFAPLTIPGMLLHAPVLLAAIVAGDSLTRRRDVRATTKVMVTVLMVFTAYAGVMAALWFGVEWPLGQYLTAASVFVLPLTGFATIRVLRRQAVFRRSLWVFVRLFTLRSEVERLKGVRDEISKRLWSMVEKYIDPTLERILPPREPPAVDAPGA